MYRIVQRRQAAHHEHRAGALRARSLTALKSERAGAESEKGTVRWHLDASIDRRVPGKKDDYARLRL